MSAKRSAMRSIKTNSVDDGFPKSISHKFPLKKNQPTGLFNYLSSLKNAKSSAKRSAKGTAKISFKRSAKSVDGGFSKNMFHKLPLEVKQTTLGFLKCSDIVNLMQTSKTMNSELQISTSSSPVSGKISAYGDVTTGWNKVCFATIIPINPGRFHSITFQCDWEDQGWGNLKGKIFLVAQDKPDNIDYFNSSNGIKTLPFRRGRVLQESKATHDTKSLTVSFSPNASKIFQLWYRVGGGGGHSLHISNMKINRIYFEYFGSNTNAEDDCIVFQPEPQFDDDSSVLSTGAMSWNDDNDYNYGRKGHDVYYGYGP